MGNPARFQQLDALFDAALERPPTERAAFLDTACAGDAGLRREVERLLAADARATSFLEQPAVSPSPYEPPEPPLPRRLGPYLLLREIGGGGMGVVYLARRDDEQYEREVAVKILRAGLRDTEAVHRFLAERQILARLEHPAIARLYDGGRQKTVAAAAISAVVALGFVVGLVEQGRNLARERDKARYALSFLVNTFREASPYETERGSLTAGEILEEGSTRVSRELAKRPDAQAAVMDAIGQAQLGLGRADAAAPLLETLLRQARATLLAGADDKRVKEIDDMLAALRRDVPAGAVSR